MTFKNKSLVGMILIAMIGGVVYLIAENQNRNDPERGHVVVSIDISDAELATLREHVPADQFGQFKIQSMEGDRHRLSLTFDQIARMYVDLNKVEAGKVTPPQQQHLTRLQQELDEKLREKELNLEDHPRIEQWGSQLLDRMLNAQQGNIVARGVIVDDEGQPLEGIDVRVVRSVARNMGWDVHDDEVASQRIDHKFHFEIPRAHGVTLYFRKDGYYPQNLYIDHRTYPRTFWHRRASNNA